MQWLETDAIPDECKDCKEENCYNCDVAGKRWVLSEADMLRTERILKLRAIERLQKQVAQIDEKLFRLTHTKDV